MKFEETDLFLADGIGGAVEHAHWPLLSSYKPVEESVSITRVRQNLSRWRMTLDNGNIWEWETVKHHDRCHCGFMPYTSPRLILNASKAFADYLALALEMEAGK